METLTLRTQLVSALIDFAWDEWGQMGVSAPTAPSRRWAQDPEALVLFTLEVAREDPRLFDEMLDWLAHNNAIVSTRRLQRLCEGPGDTMLVGATVEWVARQARPRSPSQVKPSRTDATPEPLFRNADGSAPPVLRMDPIFAANGLARPPAERSGKSIAPDLRAPINFAFRLRSLLGVGTRAEALRFLLTADIESATAADVTTPSAYAKRNVQEALNSLHAAGVVNAVGKDSEQRYAVDRARWAFLLDIGLSALPIYRDWPDLFGSLRQMLRWLGRTDIQHLSDYLQRSHARDLLDTVRPRLSRAGILLPALQGGELTWSDLEDTVSTSLWWLAGPATRTGAARFTVVTDTSGRCRWRLTTNDGRIAATSAETYVSASAALAAIKRLKSSPPSFDFKVTGDSGSFRWNVVAENGRVLAASNELFATPADATRAGRDARALISGATVAAYESPDWIDQTERHVSRQPDGRWRVDVEGSTHAMSTHATEADAIIAAQLSGAATGTVVVHEPDGRIRRLEASQV